MKPQTETFPTPGDAAAAGQNLPPTPTTITAPLRRTSDLPITAIADPAAKLANLSPAELVARVQAAELKLVEIATREANEDATEAEVRKKMESGLSRQQALTVIRTQQAYDAAIAKQWEARRPKLIQIFEEHLKPSEERLAIRDTDPSVTLEEIKAAKAWYQQHSAQNTTPPKGN